MAKKQLKFKTSNKPVNKNKPTRNQLKQRNVSILVILLFAFSFSSIKAQYLDDAICLSGGKMELDYRKKPWKGNNAFLQKYLEQIEYFNDKDKVRFIVPIKFWVYRNNDGKGGASLADIKVFIDELNYFNQLNQTGIQFYIREIQHINKTKRQIFNYYTEAPIQTIFRHAKPAINVYLIDRFKKKKNTKKVVKGTYNIATKSVILQRKNSSTGLTHEIGHYFGLLHPHRHYDKGKGSQEPVSRTRAANSDGKGTPLCEERGDLLSDTPAEPKLTFLVDNDCKFIGTALKDAWGENYISDVRNIMSYPTHYTCRDSFTLGQKAVMLYSAAGNKYAPYWSTEKTDNQKYFYDKNEPNDYFEMSSSVETGILHEFNFHKIFINKKEDRTDTCDWHKFEIKSEDKRNVKIIITPEKDNEQAISAIFYDKNLINLSEKSSAENESIELSFNNVVSDWYYIKINTKENNTTNKIDKYTLEIKLE